MKLHDDTLRLRALEPEDLPTLYHLENLEDLWLTTTTLAPYSRLNLLRYIDSYQADPFSTGELRLIIELHEGHIPVGIIDLYSVQVRHRRACVGILIDPAHQRRGYARRALALLEGYCRTHLQLHQLLAAVPQTNHPSRALFAAAGYRPIATLPDYISTGTALIPALILRRPL